MLAAAWLTAIGTIAVALAAVGVALWTDRESAKHLEAERNRSDRQLAEERARHDRELADEHARHDKELADQNERRDKELADVRAHSAAQLAQQQQFSREQLADEQAYSRTQLEEERNLAHEREQLAEAYAVRVEQAERLTSLPEDNDDDRHAGGTRTLSVIIVNHGSYTITRVEAQFCLTVGTGRSMVSPAQSEVVPGFDDIRPSLREGLDGAPSYRPFVGRLAPWDAGMRFRTDNLALRYTFGWYPVVRWTDRWGTRWEHRQGDVQQISDTALWES